MRNPRAAAVTILVWVAAVLALLILWSAVKWTANVDSETGKPVKSFVIHVEYDANEDQIGCPGTPGRVLEYSPGPDGTADILCATPLTTPAP